VAAREFPDFGFEMRRPVFLLAPDLQAFGITPDDYLNLPKCFALPVPDTEPQPLGCLYVVEGATLGGKIISRHLEEACWLNTAHGDTFSLGMEVRSGRCDAFGEMLTRHAGTSVDDRPILESAVDTFATLEAWMMENNATDRSTQL
jgi:heme oxygenase